MPHVGSLASKKRKKGRAVQLCGVQLWPGTEGHTWDLASLRWHRVETFPFAVFKFGWTYRRGDLGGHSQILAAAKSVQIHSEMAMAQWAADHPYKRGFQEVHKKMELNSFDANIFWSPDLRGAIKKFMENVRCGKTTQISCTKLNF